MRMYTTADLLRDIAFFNPGWRPADIDQRARLLRQAGWLPDGGRGRAQPPIEARHAAHMLIGLAAARKAVDVVTATDRYVALRSRDGGALRDFSTLGEAVEAILGDEALSGAVTRLTICRSWPEATISLRKARKAKKGKKKAVQRFGASAGGAGHIRIDAVVAGEMLVEIARRLAS